MMSRDVRSTSNEQIPTREMYIEDGGVLRGKTADFICGCAAPIWKEKAIIIRVAQKDRDQNEIDSFVRFEIPRWPVNAIQY